MLIVSDFNFDTAGDGVMKGIADHFTANPIDFVLERRGKPLWLTLNNHAKTGIMPVCSMSACQFLPDSGQQLRQVVLSRWFWTQVVDGVATFHESLLCRDNCFIQSLHRGFRPSR